MLAPRAVVVHRRSELDVLLEQHGTRGQAEFFLRSRGRDLGAVQQRHDALEAARHAVDAAVPADWRRATVERNDLSRMRFDPEDVVLAVGQDGLVANVAKYLAGQPVIGVGVEPGVLMRFSPSTVATALRVPAVEERCLVRAELDDGQQLTALNDLYLGDAGHQSARYRLVLGDAAERQSSSGLLVGTGTGATGWCASLAADRGARDLPGPLAATLAWFVREAWPSPSTGRALTHGVLPQGGALTVEAESDLVVFGDGLEADRLRLGWGQRAVLTVAAARLRLVVPSGL